MTVEYNLLTDEEFASRVLNFTTGLEGLSSQVEDLGDGKATIGYGYTFNRDNNLEIWQNSGISLTQYDIDILTAIDNAPSADRKNIALTQFTKTLDAESAADLAISTFGEYSRHADALGMPNSSERVAMISLEYNRGFGAVSSNMQDYLQAVQDGDRAEAWYQIRYNAQTNNPAFQNGIANRRYAESEEFGLYNNESNITYDEAVSVLQMYTRHQDQIEQYENQFSIPPGGTHNGISGIQNIKDELEPARAKFIAENGLNADTSLDILHDYIPEGSGDEVGTEFLTGTDDAEILVGAAGDDTLIGLGGNDILIGGADNDRYFFEGSWGDDVITGDVFGNEDAKGDRLFIEGREIGGDAEQVSENSNEYALGDYTIIKLGNGSLRLEDWAANDNTLQHGEAA